MKIHEYQAKELFRKFNVPTPKGKLAHTAAEVEEIAEEFGYPVVVKAQVHAGGRGKGGGVKLVKAKGDVKAVADSIIGMTLVTKQTGAEGKKVRKVLVEQGLNIKKELYLSVIPDRETATVAIVCSQDGGMDIEEVAAKTPERIITVNVSPITGFQPFHARKICFGLEIEKDLQKQMSAVVKNLYELFVAYDCSMVEINPLIITGEGQILALDAQMDIDGNALYRHPDVKEMR
ncbi:MAG: acetate--CoA ligase family protein, partial [Desulfobulbus sp.]|nr:acetate--CoA ligase family protein [Desulfobulbus sp.]